MSDILIRGMEMPTRCCECRLSTCHSFKERPLCDVLVKYMSYGEWEAKRLDDCPLVPVPPHGRLIDADALLADDNRKYDTYRGANGRDTLLDDACHRAIQWTVEDAPTVLEAEDG